MTRFQSRFNKERVGSMFDAIAPTYDRVNRLLSFGIDLYWRKRVAREIVPRYYLDIACGTGDQMLAVYRQHSTILRKMVGVDIANEMLSIARKKLPRQAELFHVNALKLPFSDHTFDTVTISFGIRNLPDLSICLQEMRRVLKPGGTLCILEFSLPENRLLRSFHLFYLKSVAANFGKWFSKHPEAYRYLHETIEEFPYGEAFCTLLTENGFTNTSCTPLTFGIVNLYVSSTLLV